MLDQRLESLGRRKAGIMQKQIAPHLRICQDHVLNQLRFGRGPPYRGGRNEAFNVDLAGVKEQPAHALRVIRVGTDIGKDNETLLVSVRFDVLVLGDGPLAGASTYGARLGDGPDGGQAQCQAH
jgi:hypothetical protein